MGQAPARVILAVDPPILAELLRNLLARPDIEIVAHPERAWGEEAGRLQVAIVSGPVPEDLTADVVIRLPEEPRGTGIGLIETPEGSRPVALRTPLDLMELLDSLLSETD